jgi:hypothetical protein
MSTLKSRAYEFSGLIIRTSMLAGRTMRSRSTRAVVRAAASSGRCNTSFRHMREIVLREWRAGGPLRSMRTCRAMGSMGRSGGTGFFSGLNQFLFVFVCDSSMVFVLQLCFLLLICILCVLEYID